MELKKMDKKVATQRKPSCNCGVSCLLEIEIINYQFMILVILLRMHIYL